jgi:phosphatidylinositol kinase/protein kinase (PI-3  family)
VHIDFGDCFERAAKRQVLPEVVPFRLTRMMVKAMGPGGVDGLYRHAFVNMAALLRENYRVLIMVLAIFVQEPLIDPEEAGGVSGTSGIALGKLIQPRMMSHAVDETGPSWEMNQRALAKLTGRDFDDSVELSVAEQATRLVAIATDPYNLSRMYSGWCPFW